MKETLLYDCADRMAKEYDSMIVCGCNYEAGGAEVAMNGDIPNLLLLVSDMLWHFEQRSGMDDKDIAWFISKGYELRSKVAEGEDVEDIQEEYRAKLREVFDKNK